MTEMRILTVRQPWAWAIIHGGKDVENRKRNIAGEYEGLVAIHAGLRFDSDAPKAMQGDFADHPYERNEDAFGVIIGVVWLGGVHHWSECLSGLFGCTPWAFSDSYHLELSNRRPLREPIPFKGALGLRRLDQRTIDRITAQL